MKKEDQYKLEQYVYENRLRIEKLEKLLKEDEGSTLKEDAP